MRVLDFGPQECVNLRQVSNNEHTRSTLLARDEMNYYYSGGGREGVHMQKHGGGRLIHPSELGSRVNQQFSERLRSQPQYIQRIPRRMLKCWRERPGSVGNLARAGEFRHFF